MERDPLRVRRRKLGGVAAFLDAMGELKEFEPSYFSKLHRVKRIRQDLQALDACYYGRNLRAAAC